MPAITYFFRHPLPIYFSMEKLFHAVAGEFQNSPGKEYAVKEEVLPFTSKPLTLRKNIRFTRRHQSEINHITGDIHYTILGCDRKFINILTIHDCVLLYHYPKSNPRHWFIKWFWYSLPIRRANVITVISENTKKDILRFTNCDPEKIRVIPNFIDPLFKPRAKPFNSKSPKLLFIGTAPNKNLEKTIEAIRDLSVELIIVGYLKPEQTDLLRDNNTRYHLLNDLPDSAMRDIYAEADIMIFPSTHEGFGLPIIEAQATGRPVLTSQLEPMISVSGNAACLVDPLSSISIREGILKIIKDESYRNELVKQGFENIKRFQIGKVTKQYADLYSEMIKKKVL